MVIDLKKCVGCYSCHMACKAENATPPGVFWARVLEKEQGEYPTVTRTFLPVVCNHCKEPPCVEVCPTGATSKRDDGIVIVNFDECIGCRSCLIVCPYQQRSFLDNDQTEYFPGQGLTPYEVLGKKFKKYQKGTVFKCDFCREKIDKALDRSMEPGIDREATPACVLACPARARYFGDIDDPGSEVSCLIRDKKGFQLHPEFSTEPSVYYLDY